MKNSADHGGCYPQRLKDNTLLDLQNSSYPTQPHSIIANYATPSSGIPGNIRRVTCIFWYKHEHFGECLYQENTSDEWDIPRLYRKKALHNYFIPCHRKYSGQMGRLGDCTVQLQ